MGVTECHGCATLERDTRVTFHTRGAGVWGVGGGVGGLEEGVGCGGRVWSVWTGSVGLGQGVGCGGRVSGVLAGYGLWIRVLGVWAGSVGLGQGLGCGGRVWGVWAGCGVWGRPGWGQAVRPWRQYCTQQSYITGGCTVLYNTIV